MAITDEERREIEEMLKEREKEQTKKKRFWSIPQSTRLLLVVAIIGFLWYATKHDWSTGKILLWLGIGGVIAWLILMQDADLPPELTEQQCAISLYKKLRWKQQHPVDGVYSVPRDVVIRVLPTGKRVTRDGKPLYREIKVTYSYKDGRVDEHVGRVDVITGDIVGFVEKPEGFYGGETPDIIRLPGSSLKEARLAKDYLTGETRRL